MSYAWCVDTVLIRWWAVVELFVDRWTSLWSHPTCHVNIHLTLMMALTACKWLLYFSTLYVSLSIDWFKKSHLDIWMSASSSTSRYSYHKNSTRIHKQTSQMVQWSRSCLDTDTVLTWALLPRNSCAKVHRMFAPCTLRPCVISLPHTLHWDEVTTIGHMVCNNYCIVCLFGLYLHDRQPPYIPQYLACQTWDLPCPLLLILGIFRIYTD